MPAGLQSRGGVEEINVLGKNLIREEGKARRSAEARWTEAAGLEKKPASRCARRDRVAGGWVRRRDLGRGARHEIAGNSRTDENQRSRTRLGAAAARSRVASTPNGAPGGFQNPAWAPFRVEKPARRRIVQPESPRSARGPGASGVEATRRGARDVLGGRTHHLASRTLANERLLR